MLIKKPDELKTTDITQQEIYLQRRNFMRAGSVLAAGALLPGVAQATTRLTGIVSSRYSTSEEKTPYKDVTTYNNYYEFGTDKSDPAENAQSLRTRPWTISVEGAVKRSKVWDIDALQI